jgi:hypothetical protein
LLLFPFSPSSQQQVLDIANTLEKEGVISVATLEWDGSLGREEQVVINRLGFLLNAYS